MNRAYPSGRLAHRGGLAGVLLALVLVSLAAWSHATTRSTAVAAGPFAETPIISGDVVAGDNFGYAVDLDGTTLVVGAQWTTVGGKEKAGAAYVFTRSSLSATQWNQVARLTASDGAEFDQFGAAVAVYGDTVAVGATLADVNGSTNQGAVYIFERNQGGPNQWGEVKKLTIPNGGNFDNFGDALAAQGDEIFVGAKDADAGGADRRGAVYVFRRGDGWTTPQELTDPNGRQSDSFGSAVAVDGNWLVVGAERADVTGNFENDGAALLFRRTAPGAPWTYVKRLSASDADGSDGFGSSVVIRGDRVLVGAPAAEIGSAFSVGKAYVFNRSQGGTDNWGEVGKLTASDGLAFDGFGIAVGLDSNAAYVGAYQADVTIAEEGAVYVFEPGGGGWSETGKVTAGDGAPTDYYGYSVVTNNETLVVGAYLASSGAGKVYAYTPAVPPQPSSVYLPLTFNPSFVPSGQLTDGGVVIVPEGVRLGAPAGSLASPLPVSIERIPAPPEPLEAPAVPRGDFYQISAAQEIIQPLDEAFILALPIPPGANRERLGIAALSSTDDLLHGGPPDGLHWTLTPGQIDEVNNLLLAVWPSLSAQGVTVVVVEHPAFLTDPARFARAAEAGGIGQTANFITACGPGVSCTDAALQSYAEALQRHYVDFFINFSYPPPRLNRQGSNLSIDPPELGDPNGKFYGFIFAQTDNVCKAADGVSQVLGNYSAHTGSIRICLPPNGTIDARMLEVIRHEMFHAFQFGFENVLADAKGRNRENWIIEGTAAAIQRSGTAWERAKDLPFALRAVDKGLRFDEPGVAWPYRVQDFWVYHGLAKLPIGIDWFKLLFNRGATQDKVAETMGFDEVYAEFIRNQVIDHNERFEEALLPECTLQEDLITAMETFPVDTTGTPARIGITRMLNSTVVELDFQEDWHGQPATIWVRMLPDGTPQPDWFHWKVYRLPYPNCASFPANEPQEYDEISPNLRYFVVLSNGEDVKDQGWLIELE